MHFATLPTLASLFLACTVIAKPVSIPSSDIEAVKARAVPFGNSNIVARDSAADEAQSILSTLSGQVSSISSKMTTIAKAAPTTDSATTTSEMNAENSSLEQALNTAVEGLTKLVGQLKGDVNLLNLAQTIVDVVADLEPALVTVEAGLSEDPALAPLITSLAATLNGPLFGLLTAVEGLTTGLLPVVQTLLAGLGLEPLLVSVQGIVDGLLTALGA